MRSGVCGRARAAWGAWALGLGLRGQLYIIIIKMSYVKFNVLPCPDRNVWGPIYEW